MKVEFEGKQKLRLTHWPGRKLVLLKDGNLFATAAGTGYGVYLSGEKFGEVCYLSNKIKLGDMERVIEERFEVVFNADK